MAKIDLTINEITEVILALNDPIRVLRSAGDQAQRVAALEEFERKLLAARMRAFCPDTGGDPFENSALPRSEA